MCNAGHCQIHADFRAFAFEIGAQILDDVFAYALGYAYFMFCSPGHLAFFYFLELVSADTADRALFRSSIAFVYVSDVYKRQDKRTRQGDEWRAQIMGICEFIESVEPKQLKQMQAEDPGLFERLLPYAYVLDLADIWAKKFKGIAVEKPSWYIGMEEYDHFDAFLFWHTFQYCFYYCLLYTSRCV